MRFQEMAVICTKRVVSNFNRLRQVGQIRSQFIVSPVSQPKPELEQLMAKINKDNLPGEVDTGPAVGNETW